MSWPRTERGRLVASAPVTSVGTPAGTHRRRAVRAVAVTVASVVVLSVAGVALVGQAVRGNRTVSVQLAAGTRHDAALDDAFYHCLDVQAHSLVAAGRTVALSTDNLADVVTMIKGFGSWVTVADPASSADVVLTLRDGVTGPDTCLGTRVVGTSVGPDGHKVVRVGTGASVAGTGPPPAPPL